MLAEYPPIAFLATVDAARSRRFYETALGLTFVSEDQFAIVFELRESQLRLQKVRELTPAQHTVFGWAVPSLEIATKELQRRGVAFERYSFLAQDENGIWTAPSGARIAWLKDPDGNVLSLTEARRY